MISFAEGEFEQARACYESFLEASRDIGDRQAEAVATANLAIVLQAQGASEAATQRARRFLAICREIGYRRGEANALHILAGEADRLGDAVTAERLFRKALAHQRELGRGDGMAPTALAFGAFLAEAGRQDEAIALLEEARELAHRASLPGTEVMAMCLLASLGELRAEEALRAFEAKEALIRHDERVDGRYLLWQATQDRAHLQEAKRLLDELLQRAAPEQRAAMIENVPTNRRVMQAWEAED
jgi:tetratricopeptide (TPR) repeat protein